jgi:hypothetical protein
MSRCNPNREAALSKVQDNTMAKKSGSTKDRNDPVGVIGHRPNDRRHR